MPSDNRAISEAAYLLSCLPTIATVITIQPKVQASFGIPIHTSHVQPQGVPEQSWLRCSAGSALGLLSQQLLRRRRLIPRQRNSTPCLRCTYVLSLATCGRGKYEVSIIASSRIVKAVEPSVRLLKLTFPLIHAAK